MKLITYRLENQEFVGALSTDCTQVLPLPYPDMNTLVETATLSQLTQQANMAMAEGLAIPFSDISLCAPIPRPRQDIICLGLNYQAHVDEAAQYSSQSFPVETPVSVYFSKRVSRAVAPGEAIESHRGLVERLDYEAELAVILSKAARNVKQDDAADYIFGYTILNDVSARDLQTGHKQWYFGKSLDGFTPMGPWIVTADEIAFPPALHITAAVNGEIRQDASTTQFIFPIEQVLEELSAGMTLLPATILATGTPSGVGMGFDPPRFIGPGDVVSCSVEGIGTLENPVV